MMHPSSPHDQFFKKALENPKVAQEFFTSHLPAAIRQVVDLTYLKMEKESFVDENLRRSISDVLFTTSFAGKLGYLWLLVEHQSSVDHLMSFRLLRYMTSIWQRHIELHKNVRELPIIYPLVLYNGKATYTAPLSFWQLFANPELAKFCLDQFQLVNLNKVPDSEFKKYVWSGIFEYFMKHIFERDFLKVLENSQDMILAAYNLDKDDTLSYLKMVLYYNINKISEGDGSELKRTLNKITQEQGEHIMTSLAQVWHQQGIQQGVQQGIQQGMQQGIQQAKAEIALQMLKEDINIFEVARLTGLSIQEIESLRIR